MVLWRVMEFPLQAGPMQVLTQNDCVSIERNGAHLRCLQEGAAHIAAALLEPHGGEALRGGRGLAYRHDAPGGCIIVRPMRRGGLVRYFLREHYLFVNRPRAEFEVHREVHARGVPCPEPLGVLWRRHGPLYSGVLATRYADARPLPSVIREGGHVPTAQIGDAIRLMHEAGVWHADLNANNLLVGTGTPPPVYIIDFDKAALGRQVPRHLRARNYARLHRSFVKLGLPEEVFTNIMQAIPNA